MFSDSNYSLDSYTHNYPLSLLSLRVVDSVSSPSAVTQEERNTERKTNVLQERAR